jgi:hypothetical protein
MYVCQQSLATHLVNDLLYLLMPDLCAVLTACPFTGSVEQGVWAGLAGLVRDGVSDLILGP